MDGNGGFRGENMGMKTKDGLGNEMGSGNEAATGSERAKTSFVNMVTLVQDSC